MTGELPLWQLVLVGCVGFAALAVVIVVMLSGPRMPGGGDW